MALALVALVAAWSHADSQPAEAQTYTTTLTLGTTEIAAADLDGATITITPNDATFILAGSGGGDPDRSVNGRKYLHPDDIPADIDQNGLFDNRSYRLNALALAEITLSGAPSGLTVSGARLLAVRAKTYRGATDHPHRSAEITLAYSGSADAITADVTVTVTVTKRLLRKGRAGGSGPIDEASVSADFVVKGMGQPIRGMLVPDDWALIPAGLGPGDSFRLMGITVGSHEATSRAIQPYNNFVRDQVRDNGHAALTSFRATEHHPSGYNIGGAFNAVGCAGIVSARKNTGTQGDGGVPIYWVNGAKIADDYGDFYDGSWDSTSARTVAGTAGGGTAIFTGCGNNGIASASPLGGSSTPDLSGRSGVIATAQYVTTSLISQGRLNSARLQIGTHTVTINQTFKEFMVKQPDGTWQPETRLHTQTVSFSQSWNGATRPFYAMSPIFTVEGGGVSQSRSEFERQFSALQSEQRQQPDTSALEASIQARIDLTAQKNDHHSNRIWRGALAAVRGEDTPSGAREVDAAFAQRLSDNHGAKGRAELSSLWQEIADALNGVLPLQQQQQQDDPPPPPADPEITITGGAGVSEGQGAVFTITASPVPAAQLAVQLSVTQSGDFASAGARTVIIPAHTASATLWVSTTDDALDEPDGSVTATLQAGSGYTLGSSSAATIAVSDDDDAPPPPPADPEITITGGAGVSEGSDAVFTLSASPAPTSQLAVQLSVTQSGDFASAGARTVIIPAHTASATLRVSTTDDALDEPDGSVTATLQAGSGYTLGSSSAATIAVSDDDDAPPPPPADPEITITGGAGVSEGGDAVFTLSASPAAASTLTVNLSVSQQGDFAASLPATVTLTGGTATLRIGTVDDGTDEPDGSITVTLASGSGYTVGASSSATVAVSDDDDPPPPQQQDENENSSVEADLIARVTALADEYEARSGESSNHFLVSWRAGETLRALRGESSMASNPALAPYHFRAAIMAAEAVGDADAAALFAEARDFLGVREL